jgi:hypothetical protein
MCLDFFPDIVGAVPAADLVAASLTGWGREKHYAVQNPLIRLALALITLGILVLVAIAAQHKLGR